MHRVVVTADDVGRAIDGPRRPALHVGFGVSQEELYAALGTGVEFEAFVSALVNGAFHFVPQGIHHFLIVIVVVHDAIEDINETEAVFLACHHVRLGGHGKRGFKCYATDDLLHADLAVVGIEHNDLCSFPVDARQFIFVKGAGHVVKRQNAITLNEVVEQLRHRFLDFMEAQVTLRLQFLLATHVQVEIVFLVFWNVGCRGFFLVGSLEHVVLSTLGKCDNKVVIRNHNSIRLLNILYYPVARPPLGRILVFPFIVYPRTRSWHTAVEERRRGCR